jgi:glycerol uptake facilitator-like aquaporin
MYKYFIELVGVVALTYASFLTGGNIFVMIIVYASVYMISSEVGYIFFNPLLVIGNFVLGRMPFEEAFKHILVQTLGLLCTLITFVPVKTFIDEAQ